ncbi:IS66 family insertion sequence element accessory protein TnpB [Pseudomonas fragi]|uniref:IS66 family insertion sequence element accessory protein TnpB n=1 Tax=Pseudomonas fragi TaxID=296 RepID=UPI00391857A0
MMRPDTKVEKVYLYPKPVDFRKSIDGLTALVELDIKVAVFDPVLFVFLNICLAVLLVTPIIPLVQINLRSK